MNTALRASLAANLVLVAAMLWLVKHGARSQPIRSADAFTSLRQEEASGSTSAGDARDRAPFQWRQLESTDYRQYIANLRGVGCPEQTIRDIITADIGSLYAGRRNQLKRVFSNFNHAGPEASERLEGALEQLQQEQAAVLMALLGPEPGGLPGTGEPAPARLARKPSDRIAVPLALQQVEQGELNLTPRQKAAVADVRQRFQAEIEAAGLSPSDPSYRALWQKAQAQSDDLLQALLGGELYIDYQLAARNAALAGAPNLY